MPTKKIALSTLSILIALSLVLAGCAQATPVVEQTAPPTLEPVIMEVTRVVAGTPETIIITPTPEPSKPKGTLTMALSADVNSLELPYAVEFNAGVVSGALYDNLLFHALDGSIQPALAESWEVGDDGLTYTFHLRQGVTFHNGEEFTADDVIYSWETYSKPEVTYASSWTRAESVTKIDDYTIEIKTPDIDPFFLNAVAISWSIIPKDYHEEVGLEGFAEAPVGTGAFMLEEWVRGDHVTLVANPNYWREGYPKVERLIFKPIPESAVRLAAVQTGEADIATRLSADEAQRLMGEPGVLIVKTPLDRVQYIGFNNITSAEDSPIRNPLVRQAINYAIDREAIVSTIFEGAAEPLSGMFSTNNPGYSDTQVFTYDPDKAKELLTEAGYSNGFSVDLGCPDGAYLNNNETCEAVVGYLADVGITVNLTFREANNHWDLEVQKQLGEMFMDSWGSSNGEAIQRLTGTLDEGEAYANWFDPQLVEMIHQVRTTMDPAERVETYGKIYDYMFNDPPFLYLVQEVTFSAINTRVQNFALYPYEAIVLWNISVSE
jgi:peptide/nickel transport system substrate-binding protein